PEDGRWLSAETLAGCVSARADADRLLPGSEQSLAGVHDLRSHRSIAPDGAPTEITSCPVGAHLGATNDAARPGRSVACSWNVALHRKVQHAGPQSCRHKYNADETVKADPQQACRSCR